MPCLLTAQLTSALEIIDSKYLTANASFADCSIDNRYLTDNALSNIGHQLISDYTKWSGCLDLAKTAVGS